MSIPVAHVVPNVPIVKSSATEPDSYKFHKDSGVCRGSRDLFHALGLTVVGVDTVLVVSSQTGIPCASLCTIGFSVQEYLDYQIRSVNESFGLESGESKAPTYHNGFIETYDSLVTLQLDHPLCSNLSVPEHDKVNVASLMSATTIASRVVLTQLTEPRNWSGDQVPLSTIGILQCTLMDIAVVEGSIIQSPGGIEMSFRVEQCWPSNEVVRCGTTTHFSFEPYSDPEVNSPSSGLSSMLPSAIDLEHGPLPALRQLILWPIQYREAFTAMGSLVAPRGILLTGPPGVGKSRAVRLLAAECQEFADVNVQSLHCSQLYQGGLGDSEEHLRNVFESAYNHAFGQLEENHKSSQRAKRQVCVSIVFLDEIDAICPKRDQNIGGSPESRIVAQLLTLMDGANSRSLDIPSNGSTVVVLGATNRPSAIDSALRRPGRFDKELEVLPPTREEREKILGQLLGCGSAAMVLETNEAKMNVGDIDVSDIAELCIGFVGADLEALVREMYLSCARREDGTLAQQDVTAAFAAVGEAAVLRGASGNVSRAIRSERQFSWDDIGGLDDVKRELKIAVEWPLQYRQDLERIGLAKQGGPSLVGGVLLHGPPGTGKTSLARAAAWASGAAFMSVTGADIYSSVVGGAEAVVRKVFAKARAATPVIIFFDEIETVVGKRDLGEGTGGGDAANNVQQRILATFLNEMDGVDNSTGGLLVMAATNRIDCIDAALLRPGRFDKQIYVGPPGSNEERLGILQVHTSKKAMPLAADVDLNLLSEQCADMTGAIISGICQNAAMLALREALTVHSGDRGYQSLEVHQRHFLQAIREL